MDVLIFARVSQDSSGVERSVDEQINDLQDWAASEGWSVVHIVRELGSASRFSGRKSRDEWEEAISWIESGKIQAILTWENSRATRDLTGFTRLRDVCANAKVMWGYGRKLLDLTKRDDRFRAGLDALLAEDESHRTSERIQRAMNANAVAGKPHGKNMYGYRRIYDPVTRHLMSIEPDPATAPIVQEAAERVLAGHSLYSIAKSFNERGLPPRRPKTRAHNSERGWTAPAVKQMLSMPTYAGLRVYQGRIIGEAQWEPLIDRALWDQLQAALHVPERRRADPWHVKHLLSGIARCGETGCPHFLWASRNNSRTKNGIDYYLSYSCERFHTSIAMKYLDPLVVETVLQRLSLPDFLESLAGAEDDHTELRAQLNSEISADYAWLEQVRERAAADRNLDVLFDQERRVLPKIEKARRQLETLTLASPQAQQLARSDDIRASWEQLDASAKREIIRTLVDIRVHPAKRRGSRGIAQAIERTEILWLHA